MNDTVKPARARLVEYVPWLLRDYATNQGPATGIVLLLFTFMGLLPLMVGPRAVPFGEVPAEFARPMVRSIAPMLVFLGTLFATNGIVSNDRKLGYFRFQFAKPLRPELYYLMSFGVSGFGLLLVTLALTGVWSIAIRPMFPLQLFAVVALMYLTYGGIAFLFSALWRFDWLSLVLVTMVSTVAWDLGKDATGVKRFLLYLLPPLHRTDSVYAMVQGGPNVTVPWSLIAWLGGYGLLCLALGLLVIRRRPLGGG